jgi:transposase
MPPDSARFQRYLDRHSPDPRDFLVLLEPTGSYGLTVLLYLLGRGYRVLQVENRAVKDYREKIFGSETKTDDTDARLMARMGFLHELVGEEFSIQPVLLMNQTPQHSAEWFTISPSCRRRSRAGGTSSNR